jgi:hypothetical protein
MPRRKKVPVSPIDIIDVSLSLNGEIKAIAPLGRSPAMRLSLL